MKLTGNTVFITGPADAAFVTQFNDLLEDLSSSLADAGIPIRSAV